jgi:hypothetical protein
MRFAKLLLVGALAGCATSSPDSSGLGTAGAGTPATGATTATGGEIKIDADLVTASLDVGGDPARVWPALLEVFEEMKIPADEVSADLRMVRNTRFVVSRRLGGERLSTFLDCGRGATGPNANTHRLELEIVSRVRRTGPGTSRIDTELSGTGMNMEGTSNTRVLCTSTHQLEALIAAKVRALVEGGTGPVNPR